MLELGTAVRTVNVFQNCGILHPIYPTTSFIKMKHDNQNLLSESYFCKINPDFFLWLLRACTESESTHDFPNY